MGNITSTNGMMLPEYNKYVISYSKQKNWDNLAVLDPQEYYTSVNLSSELPTKMIDSYDLIYHVILNEINKQGYSIKPTKFYFNKDTLACMIDQCNCFMSSDSTNTLDDINIVPTCYVPTLNNIKYILSQKKIIIAGIIIDSELRKSLYQTPNDMRHSTDVICIVGYTESGDLLIKTGWTLPVLELKNTFIENIKEMWTIRITLPTNTNVSSLQ